MTFLLGDPIFVSQPLEAKVDFVRRKAAELSAGVSSGFVGPERAMLSAGALTGAVSGLFAAKAGLLAKAVNSTPSRVAYWVTMGLGAAGGAMLGTMAGGLGATQARTSRLGLGQTLHAAARDPSDANVIGALSMGSKPDRFGPGLKDILLQKAESRLQSMGYEGHIQGGAPDLFDNLHEAYKHELQ